jgi:hypothetical protein
MGHLSTIGHHVTEVFSVGRSLGAQGLFVVWFSLLACGAELESPVAGEPEAVDDAVLCVAPSGMGSPSTIDEMVQLLNALPGPVTVPCLVESLDRPLAINSTTGVVSAQPAEGVHNPRIFIFTDGLALSIVPAGRGRDLLEIGEYETPLESLKGEFRMPIQTPVTKDALYGHLRYDDNITLCGLCHRDERLAPEAGHPNAYISRAFRPQASELVPLAAVRLEHEGCDAEADPERCAIYSALFDHGDVVHRDFATELSTIFNQ